MELQKFIENSLLSIINGVRNTNKQTAGEDISMLEINSADKILFDIAVTVSENKEKMGEVGVKVLSVSFGGDIKSELSNQNVSRIKFEIRPKGHIH